jgi:RNA polymerase sigma-70 factor (ECF subfamily)
VTEEIWLAERDRLVGLAYRLLGSIAEAEDVVSEVYLRLRRVDAATLDDPAAWLTTVTTRAALDVLRSARRRRETYVGPWLPEPVATGGDPADGVAGAETVTMALLVVLETLSPLERAVFVLHEVFSYDHAAIAGMLDRSEAAVRQTARRARAHVEARRPRFEPDPGRRQEVARRFLAACAGGSIPALLEVLADDVELTSDGGGVVTAARRPLSGARRVAAFLVGLAAQAKPRHRSRLAEVNADTALLLTEDGALTSVVTFEIADDRVTAIRIVRNPAKLGGVRP